MSGLRLEHDWFPAPLPDNVELGERSWLYSSFAFRHCHSRRPRAVRIGIASGVYLGTHFELGPDGEVEIGDYCAIVSAIIRTDRRVVIGDYSLISHDVVIADSWAAAPPGDCWTRVQQSCGEEPGRPSVVIGKNVWVCARAVLLGGTEIGEGAIIGAAAVVDFVVPPYAIVAGNPARVVGSAPPRGREGP